MLVTHVVHTLIAASLLGVIAACGERQDESATSPATEQAAPPDAGAPAEPTGAPSAAAPADSVAAAAPGAEGAPSAGEAGAPAPPATQPQGAAESAAAPAAEHAAHIEFEIYKAGFIVGVSGGRGTLHFQGKSHPLSIGGVSVGATAGISKAELIGDVRNLHSVSDIEGTYSATQAGLTVGGGEKVTKLKNSRGVEMDVRGKQMGIELSLDLNGMEISLSQ